MVMYGDFTRNTSKPEKHYSDVRMQQGRVLLDSDWNEQTDIEAHRTQTEAVDVIGQHGGPAEAAGFRIVTKKDDLTAEEAIALQDGDSDLDAGDFYITSGRYYVDGMLCENDRTIQYTKQVDFPGQQALELDLETEIEEQKGRWLVYLDVWTRAISHIEDPEVREVALGGPDTTTRSRTIWQVKAMPLPMAIDSFRSLPFGWGCEKMVGGWPKESGARLSTIPFLVLTEDKPCQISPKGGYQGLENRLYRIEIHDGGQPFAWPRPEMTESMGASRVERDDKKLNIENLSMEGISWAPGQYVEVFSMADDGPGVLARIAGLDEAAMTLTFEQSIPTLEGDDLRIRRVATFKWSRDNGSVTSAIEEFVKKTDADQTTSKVRVSPPGRDKVLTFRPGDTVEVLNDSDDLLGRPGILVRVEPGSTADKDGGVVLSASVPVIDKSLHPKLRRWDYNPNKKAVAEKIAVYPITFDPVDIEEGIRIQFSGEDFRSRDYWSFIVRTLSGKVEELKDAPPQGIKHHYAPLAVAGWGPKVLFPYAVLEFQVWNECRKIFPPLTELTGLYYVSGDGQEAMPGGALDGQLIVGVSNGGRPVANAPVAFSVVSGGGTVSQIDALTGEDGLARAVWSLGLLNPDGTAPKQQAQAVLSDIDGSQIGLPVFFNADLSIAGDVFYDDHGCGISPPSTVQTALDKISRMAVLRKVSGDCQVAVPDPAQAEILLEEKIIVQVANSCRPIANAVVNFKTDDGRIEVEKQVLSRIPGQWNGGFKIDDLLTGGVKDGKRLLDGSVDVKTDADGLATVIWFLRNDPKKARNVLKARLNDPGSSAAGPNPVYPPLSLVTFTATLSTASVVAFDPKGCLQGFESANTVQKALARLCKMQNVQEPGIVVEKITIGSRELDNDILVRPEELAGGISVTCKGCTDNVIANASRASCFVTLEIPFPLNSADKATWEGSHFLGYQPLILDSGVSVCNNVLTWSCGGEVAEWLRGRLFGVLKSLKLETRILARLTLKGNFLWSEKEPRRYLDGDTFGTPGPEGRNSLILPSGDGRRGGDFEIWFWVEPPAPA